MLEKKKIAFRKLYLNDLSLMHRWLNQQYINEWYDKDKDNSLLGITKRYAPKITGKKPMECYFCLYDEQPVGYLQKYRVNDWPEFGDSLSYDNSVVAIDLFIGEPEFMGKGFGSTMIREFLSSIVFSNPDTSLCIIGPEPNNKRAIRAYEKVGFQHVKTLQIGDESEQTYIMEHKKD